MLAVETRGSGPRIVLVHGFTQTAASWAPIADRLANAGFTVITVDAPGHGVARDVRLDLAMGAAMLADLGPAVFIGYSMGARFCLHLALNHPTRVRGLVLLGVTPGIEDEHERTARRVSDDELAAEVERDGVAAFVGRWLSNPMFAGVPADAPGNVERLTNTAAGLASSLRLAGTGRQASLWNRLSELADAEFRTQLVTGRDDIKFRTIAARMHAEIGGPAPREINGAGHGAHLEQPELFVQAVLGFLADS